MQKRPPTELVMVRRWQHSAAAEGRWGSLTKCGVTESMTDRRAYDGPSYFPSRVMKRAVEEIAQVWDDGVHDGPS
ncbi:hypothetical protein EJD97_010026 [Solanum chilense]|uniref:Uncharacterized protein n=1 Tax=Solanum chilense TaxID=4083 RepID=A0A6N2AN62_SOLCI|nr:hypothetical protein EJD97_024081 [Solanum chilense]TMW81373.1 hypothetical protein EJD97_010026 [Solanum chilense]